jgi:hypothetical protein
LLLPGKDLRRTKPRQVQRPQASPRLKRNRLSDTRRSLAHKFEVGELEGYITVGFYDDGRPGEVFVKTAKQGSTISGLVDTIAVLTSMALQYGVRWLGRECSEEYRVERASKDPVEIEIAPAS